MKENGNFRQAIHDLCKLVGWHFPLLDNLKTISIDEFIKQNDGR